MKKRLNNLKNYTKLIIVISLFVMATGIAIEQLNNLGFKKFNVPKKEYKFYLEQHEGLHDYKPSTALEFPTRGYVLNIEKTNAECATGKTIKQNVDRSVDFLANYSTICDLYYDIKPEYNSTLEKLQELSGEWQVNSGTPSFLNTSPKLYYIDDGFNGTSNRSNITGTNYITYASNYTFDADTGKYTLVNPQTCRFNSYTCRSTAENKYIVSPSGNSSSSVAAYTDLDSIYKVTDTDGTLTGIYYITTTPSATSSDNDCSDCGIYNTSDNYGTSYYVRGSYNNSYVYFAGYYWRIIRINGDGSLRLIYDGTSANAKEVISTGRYNNTATDNAYIGYMYGSANSSYELTHSNVNSSNVKQILDSWYTDNLINYSGYIEDSYFCGDRLLTTGTGSGTSGSTYASFNRNYSQHSPSLTCTNKNDRFTVYNKDLGNGALNYPIGLITGDEMAFAGMLYDKTNPGCYLNKDAVYWSMSPSDFNDGYGWMIVNNNNAIRNLAASSTSGGLVPVISLTPEAVQQFEGAGTASNPFKIGNSNASGNTPQQQKIKTLTKLQSLNPNITVNSGTPNFANAATTDEGLYAAPDDYGTSYYWRGAATTNYIKFGNWYWRIIRINGDDSLRLLYDGTSPGANGNIGTSVYNDPNNNKAYIGYMFGSTNSSASTNEANTNLNSSTIKSFIDTWYINNIKDKQYEKYISDTLFCNDRTSYIATTAYGAVGRLDSNKQPILTCPQKNDAFTVNDTNHGNGSLTYPIGLITADEASIMGSVINSFALQSQIDYWTMSPTTFTYNQVLVYGVNGNYITEVRSNLESKTKPVINISNDAIQDMTGSGTSTDPFIVH